MGGGQRVESGHTSATNVVAIAAGASHSLVLRADGKVAGWGDNYNGQINIPTIPTNAMITAHKWLGMLTKPTPMSPHWSDSLLIALAPLKVTSGSRLEIRHDPIRGMRRHSQ